MKRPAILSAVVLSTLALLVLLWQFKIAILLLILSLVLAAAFRPLVDRLQLAGMPRNVALLLSYGVVTAVTGVFFGLSARSIVTDLQEVTNDLVAGYELARQTWSSGSNNTWQSLAAQMPSTEALYGTFAGERLGEISQAFLGVAANVFEVMGYLGLALVLSLYWSADRQRFERLWLSLLSPEQRSGARQAWREIEEGVGSYLRSEFVQSLLAGLLLWAGFELIGLPYAGLIAWLGALARLLPWLGTVLAGLPPFLAGLLSAPWMGALALGYTWTVLLILETRLEPRLFPRSRISSLLMVVLATALAESFGLSGLVLALPLAVILQAILSMAFRHDIHAASAEGSTDLEALSARVAALRQQVDSSHNGVPAQTASLLTRLESLAEQTSQIKAAE